MNSKPPGSFSLTSYLWESWPFFFNSNCHVIFSVNVKEGFGRWFWYFDIFYCSIRTNNKAKMDTTKSIQEVYEGPYPGFATVIYVVIVKTMGELSSSLNLSHQRWIIEFSSTIQDMIIQLSRVWKMLFAKVGNV